MFNQRFGGSKPAWHHQNIRSANTSQTECSIYGDGATKRQIVPDGYQAIQHAGEADIALRQADYDCGGATAMPNSLRTK